MLKRILKDPFVIVLIVALFAWVLYFLFQLTEEDPTPSLEKIDKMHASGIKAETQSIRKDKFNRMMELLLALEERYQPTMGNGKLYFDIGTSFNLLEQYPLALLYYYKAKILRPRDALVHSNIAALQHKLALVEAQPQTAVQKIFFLHHNFSIPERLQIFAFLTLLSLTVFSCYIWIKNVWLYRLAILLACFVALIFVSLGVSHYLSPLEAVAIQSSSLLRGAGPQYAKASEDPLAGGTKVIILGTYNLGKWLKVQRPDGVIGFIPQESVREI
jgi:hypothetical protein